MNTKDRPAGPAAADALTVDGGIVTIRPVTSNDRQAITALYADASPENLRMRFFAHPGDATLAAEVDRLCRPQSDRFLALLAYEGQRLVGVSSCERDDEGPQAEFAVFVADHDHGRGIGTLLLEHLAAHARRLGVTELVGEVLPGNRSMLRVAHDLSPQAWAHFDRGLVDVSLRVGSDERTQQAVDERDRTAEQASLQALLCPHVVAVVGAERRHGGAGREVVRALRDFGFTGRLYVVGRAATSVDGTPVHRSLRDLPEPVDLVVIAVPADQVAAVLADGSSVGARAAVVVSTGFLGAGAAGEQRLADVVRVARSHGIRLVGPGSLGIVNTDPRIRLNASLTPAPPPAGGLGVAVQSSGAAIALLEHAVRTASGVSTLVALGDSADVSGNDLLSYWYDDPATSAVALVALDPGSFGPRPRFARNVRALSRRKPVLVVVNGHSAAVQGAADGVLANAGVIQTGGLGELLDAARMLTGQPLPGGPRLVVVGNAGGLSRLAADASGLHILPLPGKLCRDLAATAPQALRWDNPIDLGAAATPQTFAAVATAVARSAAADMLLFVIAHTRLNRPDVILSALAPVVDTFPGLPVAVVLTGGAEGLPAALGGRHAPVYDLPERAVRALARASAYAAWRRQPDAGLRLEPVDDEPGLLLRQLSGPAGTRTDSSTDDSACTPG